MDKKLTVRESARILGVSAATVQNWQRAGILAALTERSVSDFLTNRNRENRLTSRANKRLSSRVFSPAEYGYPEASAVRDLVKGEGWSREEALFYALEDLTGSLGPTPENRFFHREMDSWRNSLFRNRAKPSPRPAFPTSIAEAQDFPGWLYQALLPEGEKSSRGSYYTPSELVEDMLDLVLTGQEGETFFDPCCGTGGFLIPAARRTGDPERIYGQDSDPLAVRLARLNLMRHYPDREFDPPVFRGDSLGRFHPSLRKKRFTAIATNPPWGYRFAGERKKELLKRFPLTSGESASLFLLVSRDRLEEKGRGGFLLPESLLHRKRHGDIRQLILEDTAQIHWYGKRFSRVQSECFGLFLNGRGERTDRIAIRGNGEPYERSKKSFVEKPLGVWNIFTRPKEQDIFAKLFSREHRVLGDGSRWGLGIVTGDNTRRLNGKGDGAPILRGVDIAPFSRREAELYLDYSDRRIQQKAPLALYGEVKILYRFISRRPVACLDRIGLLTLNSVNFFLPHPSLDPEQAVMFLNSRLYGLYFEKTFHTLKVLRGQLETLPLPLLTDKEVLKMKELYPLLVKDYANHRAALDNLVYDIFGLTEKEKKYVEQL